VPVRHREGCDRVLKPRVLIAEDERNLRQVLVMMLQNAGYDVVEAEDGQSALEAALQTIPDLIMLDVMMPIMDGHEVCRRLRNSYKTRHIPIIMVTASNEDEARLAGLETGANDYITKPWNKKELELRVRNALESSRQQRAASPLTGLPGNHSIIEEIKQRISSGVPFAMLQIDIDYFKSFNDHYNYARGDEAIKTVARVILDVAEKHGGGQDFVGHVGGDDFVVLTRPERAEVVGEEIIETFNQEVPGLYDPEDRDRGWIEVKNRRKMTEQFPLMGLTIALVSTDKVPVSHLVELMDIAQELKAHGKGIPGSVLVGERRTRSDGTDAKVA
jgi:PleD family two-component response regulator